MVVTGCFKKSATAAADTRSDIYSLGVLLYELLTGKTPFDTKKLVASGLDEMRRTIREVEPVKPSTRLTQDLVAAPRQSAADSKGENGGALPSRRHGRIQELIHLVRGDLDWIVMKCLEKDRARRYETANGLASDIQRHLNNEPVVARPPSKLYEFQKTFRRHKFGFAATAAIIIVLTVGVMVSAWEAVRAAAAEREEARQRRNADEALYNSLVAQGRAVCQSGHPGQSFEALRILDQAAKLRLTRELRDEIVAALVNFDLREVSRIPLPSPPFSPETQNSFLTLDGALSTVACADTERGLELRTRHDLGWTRRSLPLDKGSLVQHVNLSPDGHWLVAQLPTELQLWRSDGAKPEQRWASPQIDRAASVSGRPAPVAFRADSRCLARVLENGSVEILDLTEFTHRVIMPTNSAVTALAFDPSGSRLAMALADSIEIRDLAGEGRRLTIELPEAMGWCAWSSDGTELAVGSRAGRTIHIKHAGTGKTLVTLPLTAPAVQFAFQPGGQLFAAVTEDHQLTLWELPDTRPIISFAALARVLQFSADGSHLAVANDVNELTVYQLMPSQVFRMLPTSAGLPTQPAYGIDISRDGTLMACADINGISLRNPLTGRELARLHQPSSVWTHVFLDHNEQSVVWGVATKGVFRSKLLRRTLPDGQKTVELGAIEPAGGSSDDFLVRLTPAGDWIIYRIPPFDSIEVWPQGDARKRRKIADRHQHLYTRVKISPDGDFALLLLTPGRVEVWSTVNAELLASLPGGPFNNAEFTPDNRWLVVGTPTEIQVWNPSTWSYVRSVASGLKRQDPSDLFFSPDGSLLIFQASPDRYLVYAVPGLVELFTLRTPHALSPRVTEFSKDGKRLYTVDVANLLYSWDLQWLRDQLGAHGFGTATKR